MTQIAKSLMALLIIVGAGTSAVAHPGHSHLDRSAHADGATAESSERPWTAATGAFRERGSFVMARDGQVQIRREDDSLVTLPMPLLSPDDQDWIARRTAEIRRMAELNKINPVQAESEAGHFPLAITPRFGSIETYVAQGGLLLAQLESASRGAGASSDQMPDIAKAFESFVQLKAIKTHWDNEYFYVESNGIPAHPMMIGITSWQQQVPIPQKYFGDNSWQIPMHPVPAKRPQSTKGNFLRGAIAVAVNGVPIFNPLNNRGDDANLFGELDEYGGHCGRADDYHYHLAPVHLETTNGKGKPIAYALDGYPIYGYEEPDGSPVKSLDSLNGHKDANGNYHYHATKNYPYLNGGFYGDVTERGGQVDPQPRAEPIRPDLRPLRDAKITDFKEVKPHSYVLTYAVKGKKGTVSYTLADDGSAQFVFADANGTTRSETYSPRPRGPGGEDRRPPIPGDGPPPRNDRQIPPNTHTGATLKPRSNRPQLVVTSSSVDSKGMLSIDCTCDGKALSPAVEWHHAPEGTRCFAVSIWHTAPDQEKSYWVVYKIPGNVSQLPRNSNKIGTIGLNDRGRAEYDPMCSKGPGLKTYHVTVFALSSELKLSPDEATRANMLSAIDKTTLAEGTLDFQYERSEQNSLLIGLAILIAGGTLTLLYRRHRKVAKSVRPNVTLDG